MGVHGALYGAECVGIACPGPPGNAIVHVPEQHGAQPAFRLGRAVEHHPEAAVDHFAPAYAAAVVQADPGGAPEGIADHVLYRHVRGEARTVVDVGRLAVGRIGTADVVVIPADHHGTGQLPRGNGVVQGHGNAHPALRIGVEDARPGAHDGYILAGRLDPPQIVAELTLDFFGRFGEHSFQHIGGNRVGLVQIALLARAADPAEGTEAVVETEWPHDVFHVGRITKDALCPVFPDLGARIAGFLEKSIAVVPEIKAAAGVEGVDGGDVAAQRGRYFRHKARLIADQQLLGRFESIAHRRVAAVVQVVATGLVGAKLDGDVVLHKAFPQVHDVALVDQRNGGFGAAAFLQADDQVTEFGKNVFLLDVAVGHALLHGLGVHFGDDADGPGNDGGARLGAGHTAQPGGDEHAPAQVVEAQPPAGIEQRDGGAVHDALRPDVHERPGGHLAVLRHAEGIILVPVLLFGIIGDHHAVGHHHARRFRVGGKEAHRMAGIQHQRLLVGHFR